jgi:hypothetical protein
MRAAAVTALVTVLSLGAAHADTFRFSDTQRPGGVARSDVAFHYKPNPPRSRTRARDPRLNPGDDYISTDNGMSCKDVGGIGICGPPRGTVHYRNPDGQNCTRTGLMEICS